MPSAADHIGRIIDAADNEQVRFDQFMNEALYGAHGFYTSGVGRAGRRGDFITSPEIGPLFGAVIARALDAWWRDMGSPDDFHIYDVGFQSPNVEAARPLVYATSFLLVRLKASFTILSNLLMS